MYLQETDIQCQPEIKKLVTERKFYLTIFHVVEVISKQFTEVHGNTEEKCE